MSVSDRNWHNLFHHGASKLEMLHCDDVNFRSITGVEVLIMTSFSTQVLKAGCPVADACSAQDVLVLVLVLVSKLKRLLNHGNSNWRPYTEGPPSISACLGKPMLVDCGSTYAPSPVE
jgi:hypothetical protein